MKASPLRCLMLLAAIAGLLAPQASRAAWQPDGLPLKGNAPYEHFFDPTVTPDGAGGVFTAWFNGAYWMRVQRLTAAGNYAPGWPDAGISPTTLYGENYHTRLAPDGAGGVYVVWLASFCNSSCGYNPGGQVYVQRMTGAGAIAPGWPAAGIPVTSEFSFWHPVVAADGQGGVLITWIAWSYPQHNRVHAQRIGPDGQRLWTATPEGAPVASLASGSPASQESPAMVADGAGGAFVTWTDLRPFANPTVFAQHFGPSGTAFNATGVGLGTSSALRRNSALSPDGQGGVFAVWADSTAGSELDLVAQHLNPLMQRQWGAGAPIAPGFPGDQVEPTVLADGAGGAFIAWSDARAGNPVVYATRLDDTGQAVAPWTAGGVALSPLFGSHRAPRLAPDAAGGFFASWNAGIARATHLKSDGTPAPGWSAGGIPLCAGNCGDIFDDREYLVADGIGGAIAVWCESRWIFDYYDFQQSFAARIVPDGSVAALASLVSADATRERVRIVWRLRELATLELERATEGATGGWVRLRTVGTDAAGLVTVEDSEVNPGTRYGYRLVEHGSGETATIAETWLAVPAGIGFRLDGAVTRPAAGRLVISFALDPDAPARLELLDIAGRRVATRHLDGLGPGDHLVTLPEAEALPAGVYAIRLVQGDHTATARVSLLR